MRRLAAFFLLLLLASPALASPEVESYLQSTDPLVARISELNSGFIQASAPLQKSRDLLAIGSLALKFHQSWSALQGQVAGLAPPAEASVYQAALVRLVEVQLESNALLRSTVDQGLALTAELKAMQESGATEEALKGRVALFSSGREEVIKRIEALRQETQSLDHTLREQRAGLSAPAESP